MLCEKCHKYQNKKPARGCNFCSRLNLPEEILCYVARSSSENESLSECSAYKPKLSLASLGEFKSGEIEETENRGLTDKDKWFIAYSKQQLQQNSDEVNFKLQFHICLVVKKRKTVFTEPKEYIEKVMAIFQQIATSFVNTQIEVIWLSSDHIHLYVSTTPDYSIDEIINKLAQLSEKEIQSSYPEIVNKYEGLWDAGYFAETVG